MNTLSTHAQPHATPAPASLSSTITIDTSPSRRLGLVDRASLRLGLWLLTRHISRVGSLNHETVSARRTLATAVEGDDRERVWRAATGLSRPSL